MKFKQLPIIAVTSALMAAPTLALADDDELEFDEAYLFFELNDTDGDLGIHGKVDGGPWKKAKIEGPNDRTLLNIRARSRLARQGMTELFFESAEPTFDELDPEDFFNRFPEGEYEWEGITTDYEEIEGEIYLSQRIPAAPVVASVGAGAPPMLDEDDELGCWGYPGDEVVIDWDPVTHTHMELGSDLNAELGDNSVIYYEFVVEIDDTEYKSTALIPPDVTEWTVPEEFIDLADDLMVENDEGMLEEVEEIKFEIIVRVETGEHEDDDGETIESRPGNQSAVESCFALEEEEDEEGEV